MPFDDMPKLGRGMVLFGVPTVFGFVIDISAGMLMTVCGAFAWVVGQLVWRIGESRARTHRLWVEAENIRLQPQFDAATSERQSLRAELVEVKVQLDLAIEAERDLAMAFLEARGAIQSRRKP